MDTNFGTKAVRPHLHLFLDLVAVGLQPIVFLGLCYLALCYLHHLLHLHCAPHHPLLHNFQPKALHFPDLRYIVIHFLC